MVARHSSENKAVPVNPLVAETEEEQAELLAGQKANEKRKGLFLIKIHLHFQFFLLFG